MLVFFLSLSVAPEVINKKGKNETLGQIRDHPCLLFFFFFQVTVMKLMSGVWGASFTRSCSASHPSKRRHWKIPIRKSVKMITWYPRIASVEKLFFSFNAVSDTNRTIVRLCSRSTWTPFSPVSFRRRCPPRFVQWPRVTRWWYRWIKLNNKRSSLLARPRHRLW